MDAYVDDLTGREAIPRNCESLKFDEPWQGRARVTDQHWNLRRH